MQTNRIINDEELQNRPNILKILTKLRIISPTLKIIMVMLS